MLKQKILEELALREDYEFLLEKLVTFGKQAYPSFGHVVILAGGAGSGKGFVKDKLLGIEGITFDVDALKKLAIASKGINARVKKELKQDLSKMDLRNPDNVRAVHEILSDYLNLPNKKQQAVFSSILSAHPDRKPNVIFDVTLKDLRKLEKLTSGIRDLGYNPRNIHIVWIVNDIEVAKKQNEMRDRRVPVEILVNTHRGAQHTMRDIVTMGANLKKYMDGSIVFVFNQAFVDSELAVSKRGGSYIKNAEFVYVKQPGTMPMDLKQLDTAVLQKIARYVPDGNNWVSA